VNGGRLEEEFEGLLYNSCGLHSGRPLSFSCVNMAFVSRAPHRSSISSNATARLSTAVDVGCDAKSTELYGSTAVNCMTELYDTRLVYEHCCAEIMFDPRS